jgi:hypothetical protein
MKTLPARYEKDNIQIIVNDKFIYRSTVFKFWKGGATQLEEKYYAVDKPIKKIKDRRLKKKDYQLYRFFELEFAPEDYLIKNNYKKV